MISFPPILTKALGRVRPQKQRKVSRTLPATPTLPICAEVQIQNCTSLDVENTLLKQGQTLLETMGMIEEMLLADTLDPAACNHLSTLKNIDLTS